MTEDIKRTLKVNRPTDQESAGTRLDFQNPNLIETPVEIQDLNPEGAQEQVITLLLAPEAQGLLLAIIDSGEKLAKDGDLLWSLAAGALLVEALRDINEQVMPGTGFEATGFLAANAEAHKLTIRVRKTLVGSN